MERQCGGCTLCCKLVPVKELAKPAGVKCEHVRFGKGCAIYPLRPGACRAWACIWRLGYDSGELSRPDRSHLVIDPVGMYLRSRDDKTGKITPMPTIQIWCDPAHPHAYLAANVLAFIRRRGAAGMATIIRYNNDDGLVLVPPELTANKRWVRMHTGKTPLAPMADCEDLQKLEMPPLDAAPCAEGRAI